MTSEEVLKNTDLKKIVTDGAEIYQEIKDKYEPVENGKFLAIDTVNHTAYIGLTSAEAVQKAKAMNPDAIFYVVKIGSEVSETIAHLFPEK